MMSQSPDAELAALARAYLDARIAYWRSLLTPPFNEHKDADHWRLARAAAEAWQRWTAALAERGVESGDRHGVVMGVAPETEEEK